MKTGSHSYSANHTDEENPYWISFSDIMAGLLVIFILAVLTLILELTQTRTQINETIDEILRAELVRQNILDEVKEELEKENIYVEISENHTVIRIPEQTLHFDSNKSRIPDDVKIQDKVLQIGKILQVAIVKKQRWKHLDTIFVEGHTDILPTNLVGGNWRLSTDRAISVWRFWEQNLSEDRRLSMLKNHGGEEKLFSVSGYGETRPVQIEQTTDLQRQKNRRIDIRFTIKRPAREEFEHLIEQFGG